MTGSRTSSVSSGQGAYYIFPEAPGGDGDAFVERALKNKLFIIPGSVFSAENRTFASPLRRRRPPLIERGIEILRSLV